MQESAKTDLKQPNKLLIPLARERVEEGEEGRRQISFDQEEERDGCLAPALQRVRGKRSGGYSHTFFSFFFFFTQIPEIEASELTLPSATVMNVMIIFLFLS